jgi:hypothetical protein
MTNKEAIHNQVLNLVQRLWQKTDRSFVGCGCFLMASMICIPIGLWKYFIAEFWWVSALAALGTFFLVAIVIGVIVFCVQDGFIRNAVKEFNRLFPRESMERAEALLQFDSLPEDQQQTVSELKKAIKEEELLLSKSGEL